MKKKIESGQGFRHIKYTNTLDEVFDTSIIKYNGWMMYGSRKHEGPWYMLTKIYNCTFDEKNIKAHYLAA